MNKEYKLKPRQVSVAVFGLPISVSVLFTILYIYFQMSGLYGGDAGDLVTASYLWGIPHPPGYPLYTFLSGLFIRLIPFGTVAWKACFMSSIPSAIALYFLWRMCFRFSKSFFASTLVVFLYGLMAPVFLNAITQEVFGLFSLMSAVFLERYTAWLEEGKINQLFFLSFWTGLSLTHHSLILLYILPACFYGYFRFTERRKIFVKHWWQILILVSIGLIPYIYAPIVSYFGTLFDQEHASTIQGFYRLVTRSSYGSFRAIANWTPRLVDRFLDVYTFFQFIYRGFSAFGIFFIGIGLYVLRKNMRSVYDFLTLEFLVWVFYFFYAGFPLLINYQMGTLERFFIVPFQILLVFCACGISYTITKRLFHPFVIPSVMLVCCMALNVFSWKNTFQAYTFLRRDGTMEQLGDDMAKSIPENSILFVFEDTSTYAMYYYYFVLQKRQDIHYIFIRWLGIPRYRKLLAQRYPDLIIPETSMDSSYAQIVAEFIAKNIGMFPVVSDTDTDMLRGTWIPHGLLFVYIPSAYVNIDPNIVISENMKLWDQFTLPNHILPYHKELTMLSDVNRVYAQHLSAVVRELAKNDAPIEQMKDMLKKALELEINVVPEAYIYPVVTLYEKNRCPEAKELLTMIWKKWGDEKTILRQYYLWSKACGSDIDVDSKAALYKRRFSDSINFFTK